MESTLLVLFLFSPENQTPYDLLLFEINQVILSKEFQEYYVFYELNQARLYQEKGELKLKFQRIHIQFPNNPFYDYNIHQ